MGPHRRARRHLFCGIKYPDKYHPYQFPRVHSIDPTDFAPISHAHTREETRHAPQIHDHQTHAQVLLEGSARAQPPRLGVACVLLRKFARLGVRLDSPVIGVHVATRRVAAAPNGTLLSSRDDGDVDAHDFFYDARMRRPPRDNAERVARRASASQSGAMAMGRCTMSCDMPRSSSETRAHRMYCCGMRTWRGSGLG